MTTRPGDKRARPYLEWFVPDPAGRPLDEVRRIRDQLHALVADLTTPTGDEEPARSSRAACKLRK